MAAARRPWRRLPRLRSPSC
uniref:Uncharacterized protein n=1 Tax=Arundo donax TaxID=35708 RepID=A0A0A9GK94_ARUDO